MILTHLVVDDEDLGNSKLINSFKKSKNFMNYREIDGRVDKVFVL